MTRPLSEGWPDVEDVEARLVDALSPHHAAPINMGAVTAAAGQRGRALRRRRRRTAAVAVAVSAAAAVLIGIGLEERIAPRSLEIPAEPVRTPTPTASASALDIPAAITTPYGPYKDLTPPGKLMNAQDVAAGQPGVTWKSVPFPPPGQVDSLGTSPCIGSDTSTDGIDGLGHDVTYQAAVPGGILRVFETVLRLDAEQRQKAARFLRDLAPCARPKTREVALFRSKDLVLTGTIRVRTGKLVNASALRLDGDQLIAVSVTGDPLDQVAIPGEVTWMRALSERATLRARG